MAILGDNLTKTGIDDGSVDSPAAGRADIENAVDAINRVLANMADQATAASANEVDITATEAQLITITNAGGSPQSITSFGASGSSRVAPKLLVFSAGITLVHSSSLVCPGAANITTLEGDVALAVYEPSTPRWKIHGYWPNVIQLGTVDQIQAGTAGGLLVTAANLWGAVTPHALTDAATIAIDAEDGPNYKLDTIGGNRTLDAMANARPGQTGRIEIIQDGTGSRTLSFNAVYTGASGEVPVLSTAAASVDMLYYDVRASSGADSIVLSIVPDITGVN